MSVWNSRHDEKETGLKYEDGTLQETELLNWNGIYRSCTEWLSNLLKKRFIFPKEIVVRTLMEKIRKKQSCYD